MLTSRRRFRARGSMLVAVLVALVMLMMVVASVVVNGGRESALAAERLDGTRAYYAAEGTLNMSVREMMSATDIDGDGRIGGISYDGNDANDPVIGGGPARVTFIQTPMGEEHDGFGRGRLGIASRKPRVITREPIGIDGWMDAFESYASGTQLHGLNGWQGWDDLIAAGAVTTDLRAYSGHASVDCGGASDLVHTYNLTSGQWRFSCRQFISSSAMGADTFFILMNTYSAGGTKYWSTQIRFLLASNEVYDNLYGFTGSTVQTLVRDQWIPIVVDIDLDAGTQVISYNGGVIYTGAWVRNGGTNTLQALDLYGCTIDHVWYDRIKCVPMGTSEKPVIVKWAN